MTNLVKKPKANQDLENEQQPLQTCNRMANEVTTELWTTIT